MQRTNLKRARENEGLTQEEFAKKLDIKCARYTRIEQALNKVDANLAIKIGKFFGLKTMKELAYLLEVSQ